jgi:hypothetical protein
MLPPRLVPEVPLPATPYLPGRSPHPRRSAPLEPLFRPAAGAGRCWRERKDHLYALDLFHHGFYWEAHEVWEEIWKSLPRGSPEWHASKALIQVAAVHLKLRQGHRAAAATLARSALLHLETALGHARIRGGPCLDLDLVELAAALAADPLAPPSLLRLV